MRAKRDLSYVVEYIPDVPEIFQFIQERGNLSDKEMYSIFNMGAGLAVFVSPAEIEKVLKISAKHKIKAWVSGEVKNGVKKVTIKPLNITYLGEELKIR